MPRLTFPLLAILSAVVVACVTDTPLEPGAATVKMTHKESDVASCSPVGIVNGMTESNYVSDQRREMKNQTADLGGDMILLSSEHDPPKGIAYRCNPPLN